MAVTSAQEQRFELHPRLDAAWDDQRAYLLESRFIQNVSGSFVKRALGHSRSWESCDTVTGGRLSDCEPSNLTDGESGHHASTAYNASYLILAAAYGATRASIQMNLWSERGLAVCQVHEGETSSHIMEYEKQPNGEYVGRLKFVANDSFMAVLSTKGGKVSTYEVRGPSNETWTLHGVFPITILPPRFILNGTEVEGAQFVGGRGMWTVESRANATSEGPFYTYVGILNGFPVERITNLNGSTPGC